MKFIKIFFLTAVLVTSILFGFVLSIDPYNKLGINVFNFATKAVDFPRVNKFNMLEHSKKNYEAFIIGSSAANRYPTKVVKDITGLETFNYAVQSATPEDYYAIFNHITHRSHPKLVILSFDFYGLNKFFPVEDMLLISPLKKYLNDVDFEEQKNLGPYKTYFTLEALGDSYKVVWVNLFGHANHSFLENGDYFKEPPAVPPIKISQFPYPPFEFDSNRLELCKKLKKKADDLGVKLIVFTSPLSYEHWERIAKNPELLKNLEDYKIKLANIFGGVYDFTNKGAKNFNDIKYFGDSTHPSVYFSEMILKRLLKPEEMDGEFGRFVSGGVP